MDYNTPSAPINSSEPDSRPKSAYSQTFLRGFRQIAKTTLLDLAADKDLTNRDRQVLVIAFLEERAPGEPFKLSAGHLARSIGMNIRTAERILQKLVRLAWLSPATQGSGKASTEYTITRSTGLGTGAGTGGGTGGTPGVQTGTTDRSAGLGTGASNNIRIPTNTAAAGDPGDSKAGQRPPLNPQDAIWTLWSDANVSAGLRRPVAVQSELEAAQTLAGHVSAGELTLEDLAGCMTAYLADTDDWLVKNGHSLRWLPRRINAYINQNSAQGDAIPSPDLIDEIESAAEEAGHAV